MLTYRFTAQAIDEAARRHEAVPTMQSAATAAQRALAALDPPTAANANATTANRRVFRLF